MKRILIALFVLMTCFPLYGQDVVLPFLIVLDWIQADSINIRSMTVTSAIDLEGSVSGKFVVEESLRVNLTSRLNGTVTAGATATDVQISSTGNITMNTTIADQEAPTFQIGADFDTDASATTGYTLTLNRTGNATPTSGYWTATSTGGLGIQMPNIGIGIAPSSSYSFTANASLYISSGNIECSNGLFSNISPLSSSSDLLIANKTTKNIYIDIVNGTGVDGEIRLGDTGNAGEYSRVDSVGVFYSPSNAVKIADVITSNNAVQYVKVVSLADGEQHLLPTGKAGFGKVSCNGEFATFYFLAAGNVSLVTAGTAGLTSANVTTTENNDTTLNIFDDGDGIGIENELGSTLNVLIDITYYTP